VVTLSGIFRDLFPLQVRLIAEAALLAATADEPLDRNFVRRHALAHQATLGCDLETAALRVFSNAEGAYGANVSLLVDSGRWTSDDALAETYVRRKSFAYGRTASGVAAPELFDRLLAGVELSYQNLDAVESGATDIDQYVDSLGGLSRAVGRARGGAAAPVYFGDETGPDGTVRTAAEQIALESHTRLLNPKWYEAVLKSGYEGARTISAHVTHTLGWSATTGAVPGWVYREACATFVLDPAMRDRLAALNGHAAVQLSERLLEAHDRGYWQPSDEMLAALRDANAELEDRLEGVEPVGAGGATITSGAERFT
jgi:magnesium chelatase subunit H